MSAEALKGLREATQKMVEKFQRNINMATRPTFDELPYKNEEGSQRWNSCMARYQHTGCPGIEYQDICINEAGAIECAAKGVCKKAYNDMRDYFLKTQG